MPHTTFGALVPHDRVRGKKAEFAGIASPVLLEIGIGDDSALGTFAFSSTTTSTKVTLQSE